MADKARDRFKKSVDPTMEKLNMETTEPQDFSDRAKADTQSEMEKDFKVRDAHLCGVF